MLLYSYKSDNMEAEKLRFLNLLYRDKRNGQAICLKKNSGKIYSYSTCDLQDLALAATGTEDTHVYTSVNAFRGSKRSADKIYCYCSIYIDLDCHVNDKKQVEQAKKKTVELLEDAYASGMLPVPTMVTDTGRGYGIQYVLQKSIANSINNAAQRTFFKKVRESLNRSYKMLMDKDSEAATVDQTAIDDSRVCRVPGNYNVNAGTFCRLIYAEDRFYELSELARYLWDWKEKDEYQAERQNKDQIKKAARKIIPFKGNYVPFLRNRVEQLRTIQELRDCTDSCREQLLFIAYCALFQIDASTAEEELRQMNMNFTVPLGDAEVSHIVKEIADRGEAYKISDAYVIRSLDLQENEIEACNFGSGWRRKAKQRENAIKKNELRQKVIRLLKQADQLTYNEIAEQVGISRRSVCNIAKEAGISRYNKKTSTEVVAVPEKGAEIRPVTKSAKKCIVSVCVDSVRTALCGFSGTGLIFLQLLRVYDECIKVPSLQESLFQRMSSSLDLYATLSEVALMTAQLEDLRMLSLWLIDVQVGCSVNTG